jgi:hypothetical protein
MISVDVELALVGLVAMLEPATLISSLLALVLGDRPMRTGLLFYLGGIGVTLAVGVAAAFVLGNAAAAPRSGPSVWVVVFDFVAAIALLAYAAWTISRTPDPAKTEANVERMRKVADAPAITILAAGALLANAGPFMLIALKNVSELNPSAGQYIIDWIVFAVASLLPLGLALVALAVAPGWTKPRLAGVGGWVERHARAIAVVVMVALAISLLRDGIAAIVN